MDFIAFIEFNRQIGVKKFIIYILDLTEEMKNIIDYYAHRLQILYVLPWKCPFSNQDIRFSLPPWYYWWILNVKHPRYFCQNLLLNDCLHRSRSMFNFTMFVDLDEACWHFTPGYIYPSLCPGDCSKPPSELGTTPAQPESPSSWGRLLWFLKQISFSTLEVWRDEDWKVNR